MTKRNNVNPDHYKVAGRERPGDAVVKEPKAQESASERARASRWRQRQKAKAKAGT